MSLIGIIDHKFGNTKSVLNLINYLNVNYKLCKSYKDLNDCSHIILPGIGSFNETMNNLDKLHFIDSLEQNVIEKKKFFLGICVGFQILFSKGLEFGETKGLNWIEGICEKFNSKKKIILPHCGWNKIASYEKIEILKNISSADEYFYFLHSYMIKFFDNSTDIKFAYTKYGQKFISAVEKNNIFGVQFHPEKSQQNGISVLKAFCSL
jgi:glutamine amidotransferase